MKSKLPIFIEGHLDKAIVDKIIAYIAMQSGNVIKSNDFFVDKANGIHAVLEKVLKANTTCIGIIDNDKRKPTAIQSFEECRPETNHNLQVFLNENNGLNKYLFIFDPASEAWLVQCANSSNVIADFPILNDTKALTKVSKSSQRINELNNVLNRVIFGNAVEAVYLRKLVYKVLLAKLK